MTFKAAKRTLKAKGWSYRSAAPVLGVCYQHLAAVLTNRRESQRLLAKIEQLPAREKAAA
jgi:lambda repressor-like predicted transcriptional regulator